MSDCQNKNTLNYSFYYSNPENKLFVGQLPKFWNNADLKSYFEEFGCVIEANIIKDRFTGIPRGCGFVTFSNMESSQQAQKELHGKRIIAGMIYPMYVRPADVNGGKEGKKLFIGMIGKSTNKHDLYELFHPLGEIEDITVLQSPEGISKGCAFIKYTSYESALSAIHLLNNKITMKGCSSPMVVRVAETEQEKVLKKLKSAIWAITKVMEDESKSKSRNIDGREKVGILFNQYDPNIKCPPLNYKNDPINTRSDFRLDQMLENFRIKEISNYQNLLNSSSSCNTYQDKNKSKLNEEWKNNSSHMYDENHDKNDRAGNLVLNDKMKESVEEYVSRFLLKNIQ